MINIIQGPKAGFWEGGPLVVEQSEDFLHDSVRVTLDSLWLALGEKYRSNRLNQTIAQNNMGAQIVDGLDRKRSDHHFEKIA